MSESNRTIEQRLTQLEQDVIVLAQTITGDGSAKAILQSSQASSAAAAEATKQLIETIATFRQSAKALADSQNLLKPMPQCLLLALAGMEEIAQATNVQTALSKIQEAKKTLGGNTPPSNN